LNTQFITAVSETAEFSQQIFPACNDKSMRL